MSCECGPYVDHHAVYIPGKGFYIECMECQEKAGSLDDAASRKLGLDKCPKGWSWNQHEDGGWEGAH